MVENLAGDCYFNPADVLTVAEVYSLARNQRPRRETESIASHADAPEQHLRSGISHQPAPQPTPTMPARADISIASGMPMPVLPKAPL